MEIREHFNRKSIWSLWYIYMWTVELDASQFLKKKSLFLLRFIDISFPFEMNFMPISEIRVVFKACICMCKIFLLELFSPVVQVWVNLNKRFILSWCNIFILFTFSSSYIGHLYWINFNSPQLKSSHISLRNKVGVVCFILTSFWLA